MKDVNAILIHLTIDQLKSLFNGTFPTEYLMTVKIYPGLDGLPPDTGYLLCLEEDEIILLQDPQR